MSLKSQFKEKFGVDLNEMIARFEAAKATKSKFEYDVDGLPAWTDNTLPNLTSDLIGNSEFLSELTLESGVKGTKEIALLNADITLQAKVGCTSTPDGSVVFTDKALTTHLLYSGVEFCNEDLNGKMTQILNALGVKAQNGQLPAEIETILMAYLTKLLQRKAQRVVVLGDESSLDPELALFDGLINLIESDLTVANFTSTATAVTASNAYDLAYGVFTKINPEIFDNGMAVRLYTGRKEALLILKQWNDTNPYSQVDVPMGGTSMRFMLPLTGIEVVTLPELNGLDAMYAIPTSLAFLGVDDEADMALEIKYDDYNDKLKAEASFRLGTQIVWGKYFTKLILA